MVVLLLDIVISWSCCSILWVLLFFFKQKTAYEMRISDWSSDVCSSDLLAWSQRGRHGGASSRSHIPRRQRSAHRRYFPQGVGYGHRPTIEDAITHYRRPSLLS